MSSLLFEFLINCYDCPTNGSQLTMNHFCVFAAIFSGYRTIDKDNSYQRDLMEHARALADMKFTYVVSCQIYGAQKKSSDARDRSCYANILNLMLT